MPDSPALTESDRTSILWNIYENMFPHDTDPDPATTRDGYLAMTKEQLADMLEYSRERLGRVLHGDLDA